MRDLIIAILESIRNWNTEVTPCPIEQPLRLTWVSSKNPYEEAHLFRTQRIPSSVYGLLAWEVDYVKMLLSHLNVEYSFVHHPSQLSECHIVVYSCNQFKRAEIRNGLIAATPRLVFHMSDEWGRAGSWYPFLKKFPLVLRQYYFDSYPKHPNIKTIPLGFMHGMLPTEIVEYSDAGLESENRPYVWSFIGTIKGKRAEALENFASSAPHYLGTAHPLDMAEIYCKSKFVVCPAGNVNILCFRNFEASICGAIPIVGGCSLAKYNEATIPIGSPPWIFHEDWQDARDEMEALLTNKVALQARQQAVVHWWWSEIKNVKRLINSVLAQ